MSKLQRVVGVGGLQAQQSEEKPRPVQEDVNAGDAKESDGSALHARVGGQVSLLSVRLADTRLLAMARKNKPVVVVAKFDGKLGSVVGAGQTIADFDRVVDSRKNRLIRR